jgi:hypothetical protein
MGDKDFEMNIVDALFVRKPSYIVLISGLIPELEEITSEVAKDLGFTYLCFSHVKSNYNPVNKRVHELLDKKVQGIIVCGSQFPSEKLDFKVNYHIHLSINKTMFADLKSNVEFDTYTKNLKTNFINKYINIKAGYKVVDVADDVFDNIIKQIDSIVHKDIKIEKVNYLSKE